MGKRACRDTHTGGTGEYVDDSIIMTTVKSPLAEDNFLNSFEIILRLSRAGLSGFVNSKKAIDKEDEIVRSVKGLKSIRNDLIVK